MNVQMMEGLVGASTNIGLSDVSMGIYQQASAEGNTEKMKRALEYTGKCTEKAAEYQEKLDKGMKTEAEEQQEKAKLERDAAIEKCREDREKLNDRTEPDQPRETDTLQISEESRKNLEANPDDTGIPVDMNPVIYTESGQIAASPESGSTVSFSA